MSKSSKHHAEFPPIHAQLIDSHCHVVPRCFGEDTLTVAQRALDAGLERMVNIGAGYGLQGNREVLELAVQEPRLHPTIGIHPHDAALLDTEPDIQDTIEAMAARPEVVAVGETGLDYYYTPFDADQQARAFKWQIELALRLQKALIIHDRDAHDDTLAQLDQHEAWGTRVVIHCFSGDWALAHRSLERGAYISIPGIVTFKNAIDLKEVAAKTPLDRLLIETDSPYLAPVPYRGKKNEPAYVHAVAREIALLRGCSVEEVVNVTAATARTVFGLPAAQAGG